MRRSFAGGVASIPSGTYVQMVRGLTTDGTDNATLLQAAHDALPAAGGELVLDASGSVTVNSFVITKDVVIRGRSEQATILTRSSVTNPVIRINAGASVVLEDLTIDGASYVRSGIVCAAADSLTMRRVTVKRCGVPGYSVAAGSHRSPVDGVFATLSGGVATGKLIVQDCTFEDCERDGILGFPVLDMTVEDSVFRRCGRFAAVNQQDDGNTISPVTTGIHRNRVYECGAGGFDVETATSLDPTYVEYSFNQVIDSGDDDWTYGWGISFGLHSYGVATGNRVVNYAKNSTTGTSGLVGFNAFEVGGPTSFVGNVATGGKSAGLLCQRSLGYQWMIEIVGGQYRDNRTHGIYILNYAYVTVTGADVHENGINGMLFSGSANPKVVGGRVRSNSKDTPNTHAGIKFATGTQYAVSGAEFGGAEQKYCVETDDPAKMQTLSGNTYGSFGTDWYSHSGGTAKGGEIAGGQKRFKGTTAPTTLAWVVGDWVVNTAPTANGVTGWVCTTAGTPGTWTPMGTRVPYPEHVFIGPGTRPKANTNWSGALTYSSTAFHNALMDTQGGPTQNDTISWDVALRAGTWTLALQHMKGSNRGIYTIALAPVAVDGTVGAFADVGTVDGYNAALTVTDEAVTGIVVADSSIYRLRLTMATKHASSAGYRGSVSALSLTRTA